MLDYYYAFHDARVQRPTLAYRILYLTPATPPMPARRRRRAIELLRLHEAMHQPRDAIRLRTLISSLRRPDIIAEQLPGCRDISLRPAL